MIYRRVAARLKAQDWLAITIEVIIVIVGVFIGTQVSKWNQERLAHRDADKMLVEIKPVIRSFVRSIDTATMYYRASGSYAQTALLGWQRDPSVSDEQFVISAYQASQIYFTGLSGTGLAMLIGADRLRNIEDPKVRENLSTLMIMDIPAFEAPLSSDYRKHVRQVMPDDIQDAIRAQCGERRSPDHYLYAELPPTCDLGLPIARFAAAAADLRNRPELRGDLRLHGAIVASFVGGIRDIKTIAERLLTGAQNASGKA